MIMPRNTPQLSSAKPRCGLQSVSELLPRLIRQYEMQAEMMQRHLQPSCALGLPSASEKSPPQQAKFAWYE